MGLEKILSSLEGTVLGMIFHTRVGCRPKGLVSSIDMANFGPKPSRPSVPARENDLGRTTSKTLVHSGSDF